MDVPAHWLWHSDTAHDKHSSGGRAVVFDIDGVLCNADGRQHFLAAPNRDWKGFFEACGSDTLIEETGRLLALIDPAVLVVLLTGRPFVVQPMTLEWLQRHGVRWDLLIMRNKGEYGASMAFKQQTIRRLKTLGFDLRLAFEDDRKNREMFQNEGVPCTYVHSGYYDRRDSE